MLPTPFDAFEEQRPTCILGLTKLGAATHTTLTFLHSDAERQTGLANSLAPCDPCDPYFFFASSERQRSQTLHRAVVFPLVASGRLLLVVPVSTGKAATLQLSMQFSHRSLLRLSRG